VDQTVDAIDNFCQPRPIPYLVKADGRSLKAKECDGASVSTAVAWPHRTYINGFARCLIDDLDVGQRRRLSEAVTAARGWRFHRGGDRWQLSQTILDRIDEINFPPHA
jgi:hypothetical protein